MASSTNGATDALEVKLETLLTIKTRMTEPPRMLVPFLGEMLLICTILSKRKGLEVIATLFVRQSTRGHKFCWFYIMKG